MLTVSDIKRTKAFYNGILGMDVIAEDDGGTNIAFSNGSLLLAARTPFDPQQTPANDQFNENRMGLDHLSLSVDSRADLEAAVTVFDANGVSHGEIQRPIRTGIPNSGTCLP